MKAKPVITKSVISVLCLIFSFLSVSAQDESVIYIGTNGKLTSLQDAIYMQNVKSTSPAVSKVQSYKLKDSKWEKAGLERYKMLNDSTYQINFMEGISKRLHLRTFVKQPDNSFKFTDIYNGKTMRTGLATSIMPLLFHGQVTEYYPDGNKKSVSHYNHNELVSNENWNKDGEKYIDNVFYSADSYPRFNPGINVLYTHILKAYKDAGIDVFDISGSLSIGFVVMEDGTIDGIKLIKGIKPFINNVALKAFTTLEGTWTPARLNNQSVRYFQVFPINFINKEQHFEHAEFSGNMLQYTY